jgi:hypothetical protein
VTTPIRPSLVNVYLVAGTASVCLGASAVLDREPLPFIDMFGSWAPIVAVLIWLHGYARSRRIEWVYDWGYLFWVTWPLVLPLYAMRLEGRRRGWRLVGWLTVLSFGPGILAGVLRMIRVR